MSFTPNMTQEEVDEYDRRRQLGDTGLFNDPDILTRKEPWLRPDGTHKSTEEKEDKMSDYAEAIETLKSMKIPEGKRSLFKRSELENEKNDVRLLEEVLDSEKKEVEEESNKGLPGVTAGQAHRDRQRALGRKERQQVTRMPGKAVDGDEGVGDGGEEDEDPLGFGKNVMPTPAATPAAAAPSVGMTPATPPTPRMATTTMKALSTRSFHIPPPLAPYDPFRIQQSGGAAPYSPAALNERTYQRPPMPHEAYKSCDVHGIQFRAESGCHPCNVQKSLLCSACGAGMHKSFGGVLRCPRGH